MKISSKIKVFDAINMSQLKDNSNLKSIEVYRRLSNGVERIININYEKILQKPSSPENINIIAGDNIIIRKLQSEENYKTVMITGAIKYPGEYNIKTDESIESLLARAGGLKPDAFLKGLVLERKSIKQKQNIAELQIIEHQQKQLNLDLGNKKNLLATTDIDQSAESLFLKRKTKEYEGRLILKKEKRSFDEIVKIHIIKR